MKLEKTYSDTAMYGNKYNFYHNVDTRTVVCTTMYKGQTIRGVAKCDPEDEFNLEVGKMLSYLRCKQKFACKKLKHAYQSYDEARKMVEKAINNRDKILDFVEDADYQYEMASANLWNFEQKLGIDI